MNVNNLRVGQIVKNYKVLCEILGQEIKAGKGRQLQLKEFERYFEYHKDGQKFIIDCIYDEPLQKIDKRSEGNNSKYKDDIAILILDLLAQSKTGQLFLSAGMLLRKLDMVNSNYTSGRRYIAKLSELTNVPEKNIYDFYNYTQSKLKRNLESALNDLRKKSLIQWSTEITVCYRNINMELNSLNEIKIQNVYKDKVYFDTELIHRKPTDQEVKLILKCERETLKELGMRDQQQVFISGLWSTFRNKVNLKLKTQGNIEYYYNSYEITYNHEDVLEELEEISKLKTKTELNNNIMLSLAELSLKRYEKATNKILSYSCEKMFGESTPEEPKSLFFLHSSNDYIEYNNKLIDTTIHMFAKDISEDLKLPISKEGKEIISDEEVVSDLPF